WTRHRRGADVGRGRRQSRHAVHRLQGSARLRGVEASNPSRQFGGFDQGRGSQRYQSGPGRRWIRHGSIAQRPNILDQRRETVEHPFGTIKQWMNQGAFLMRGLEKVRAEFSLTALAYNLRRVLNIVGLPKLIAALPA